MPAVTLYTYSENPAYEKLSEPVETTQGECLEYSLAVEFAREKGFPVLPYPGLFEVRLIRLRIVT